MLRSYFAEIPYELEQAAMIDGCSSFQAILYVTMPLSVPALIATGLYTFLLSWNEFLFATVVIESIQNRVVTISIYSLLSEFVTDWACDDGLFRFGMPSRDYCVYPSSKTGCSRDNGRRYKIVALRRLNMYLTPEKAQALTEKARKLRQWILDMVYNASSGHWEDFVSCGNFNGTLLSSFAY